nr:hypothetical protein [Stella humosa]
MALDLGQLGLHRLGAGFALRRTAVPQILEHRPGHLEQGLGRLERAQERLELALDVGAPDRLAVLLAAALGAVVVGVRADPPLRPAGRQRRAAVGTDDEAAQREVLVEVAADRRPVDAVEPLLDALVGPHPDQRLMLSRPPLDAEARRLDIAGIDTLPEQHRHPLVADAPAGLRLGEEGMVLEEAHHVGLGLEVARGIAFEGFLDDRGGRLVALQHLPAARHGHVLVADRRLEHPVAVHDPGAHAVLHLLAVLLALVLGDAGEQVLDQDRVRVLAELDGGGLQVAAGLGDGATQLQVGLEAAGQARDVVDDDDSALGAATPQEGQHGLHAGPVDEAAGDVVAEHLDDGIALHPRELAAAGLL